MTSVCMSVTPYLQITLVPPSKLFFFQQKQVKQEVFHYSLKYNQKHSDTYTNNNVE